LRYGSERNAFLYLEELEIKARVINIGNTIGHERELLIHQEGLDMKVFVIHTAVISGEV